MIYFLLILIIFILSINTLINAYKVLHDIALAAMTYYEAEAKKEAENEAKNINDTQN